MAATVSGLDVHVGTETLNRLGELGALLEGRMTYELRQDKLIPRSQYRIRADWPQAPVLAQHACRPVPPEHIDQAWSLAGMAIVIQAIGGVILNDNHSAEPPF